MKIVFAYTALLWAAAAPLESQVLSLDALLAEADAHNPRIVAARSAAAAAEARVPQAGALPDPMVGIGLMNVPVRDPGLGNDMMTMAQVRIDAGLPWPGKLSLSHEAALLRAQAATWEIESVRQDISSEVQSLYFEVYFLDRAAEVVDRNIPLLADLTTAMSETYAVGGVAQVDLIDADVERTRLMQERAAILEQRRSMTARLEALLGRTTRADIDIQAAELPDRLREAALSGVPATGFATPALSTTLPSDGADSSLPSVAELQQRAAESNPAIQAHVRRVRAQESAVALAGKGRLPDFNVSAGYSHRTGLGDMFDVMVSAPLPVFAGRKQSRAVAEQEAMLAEFEASHHAMLSELDAEIASKHAELRRIREHLLLLADGILPQVRASFSAQLVGYRVGDAQLGALLATQAALYRHELEYHRLLADFARSMVAMERAVGSEVVG